MINTHTFQQNNLPAQSLEPIDRSSETVFQGILIWNGH